MLTEEKLRRSRKVFECLKKNSRDWCNYPQEMEFVEFANKVMHLWYECHSDEKLSKLLDFRPRLPRKAMPPKPSVDIDKTDGSRKKRGTPVINLEESEKVDKRGEPETEVKRARRSRRWSNLVLEDEQGHRELHVVVCLGLKISMHILRLCNLSNCAGLEGDRCGRMELLQDAGIHRYSSCIEALCELMSHGAQGQLRGARLLSLDWILISQM